MSGKSVLFGTVLKEARKKARIQQKDFAEMLGVSRNTVINWEADKYKPDHELLPEICSLLGVSLNDLFGINDGRSVSRPEFNLILDYRELSDVGKKFAESMLATLLETERKAKDEEFRKTYRLFGKAATKAAAGTGCDFVDSPLEPIFIKRNTRNKRADSIVEVSGDSMLPVYHNGDLVYVQHTQGIDPGEDVVCSSADGMVIKRVTADRKLVSVNPALPYGDKSEDDHVRVIGRVIGIVEPADCADAKDTAILEELFRSEIRTFRQENRIYE